MSRTGMGREQRRRCDGQTHHGRIGFLSCARPAVRFESGKWWCQSHGPTAEAAQKRRADARYEEHKRKQEARWKREDRRDLCERACADKSTAELRRMIAELAARGGGK